MAARKILVVDDEANVCKAIERILHPEGYQAQTATSGKQAIAKARIDKPDLILMDIAMPGLNGIETCKIIREDPKLATIPIIMISAKSGEDDITASISSGADDYIMKPFQPEELIEKIRHVFVVFEKGLLPSQVKSRFNKAKSQLKPGQDLGQAQVKEKRKFARAAIDLPVDYISETLMQYKDGKNIGLGGIFIQTQTLEPVGTKIKLIFFLPGRQDRFEVQGKVIWIREKSIKSDKGIIYSPGMGIKFIKVTPQAKNAIKDLTNNK